MLSIRSLLRFLSRFSLGQLQSGYTYQRPERVERRTRKTGQATTHVAMKLHKVKGTGIPASTLKRFLEKTATPRKKSLDKINKFYQRWAFQTLHSAGANKKQARSYQNKSPAEIMKLASDYKRFTKQVAKDKNVPLIALQWGARLSNMTHDQWETYVKTKPYK